MPEQHEIDIRVAALRNDFPTLTESELRTLAMQMFWSEHGAPDQPDYFSPTTLAGGDATTQKINLPNGGIRTEIRLGQAKYENVNAEFEDEV